MTDKEERIRTLVKATLKVYEDLELARKALSDLYTVVVAINEPVVMPQAHSVSLLDEAIGWVSYETYFRERYPTYESRLEWLGLFLEETND